jgi:hypothetical protein
MTIVSLSHKFIFVHIPKTAGTALKEYLFAYANDDDIYIRSQRDAARSTSRWHFALLKHSNIMQIRETIGDRRFSAFFKFSIVRNPFERTVSTFLFLKHNFRNWKNSAAMDQFDSLQDFVNSPLFRRPGPGRIFEPQKCWLTDAQGVLCVDYVARMESLTSDIAIILKQLGLPAPETPIPQQNRSKGYRLSLISELSSGAVIDSIRSRYAKDFELFKYATEPSDALVYSASKPEGFSGGRPD